MTIQPFSADEWRDIFKAYKDTPQQQTGVEILRQLLIEDSSIDSSLLTKDSTWFIHFNKTNTPYWP